MQLPEEKSKKQTEAEPNPAHSTELSSAWHALLGAQFTPPPEDELRIDPAAQVQPQASDPWNTLLHTQGVEAVDLQKVHLHDLHAVNSAEIEYALNIIQEASNQPATQGQPPEKPR